VAIACGLLLHPAAGLAEPVATESVPEVPADGSDDAKPAEPEPREDLVERARLLEDLYHAVAAERRQHDQLTDQYQLALRRARELANDHFIDEFLLGLARAHALALDQTGERAHLDLMLLALDELVDRLECRRPQEPDDTMQLEDARLLRARHGIAARAEPPCRRQAASVRPTVDSEPGPVGTTDDVDAQRSVRRRDIALLATGSVLAAGGLVALALGASGKAIARSSGRLMDPPTEEQQQFLDEELPKRRAIWMGVGGTALAAGVAMLTAGGVLMSRRRTRSRARASVMATPREARFSLTFEF